MSDIISANGDELKKTGILNVAYVEDEKPSMTDRHQTFPEKYCMEDAIKATGHGRFHIFLLFVCGLSMMGVVVENVNIGFVLPYVRCEMRISTVEQGLLNSVGYFGIVISSHLWGFLADTSGRRRVLMIAMSGSFICAILSAFSINVIMLIVTRLCVGVFVSGVQAATYSYIGEFHSNATRTKTLSFVAMFMPACFVYLPSLAWLIIPMEYELLIFDYFKFAPWRIYLLCSSLLNGFNLLCLWKLPESPKFLLSIDRKEEALDVLRRVYAINSQSTKRSYPIKDLLSESTGTALSDVHGVLGVLKLVWNQTWPLFAQPHIGNTIKLCYLMFILFSIGHGTFMWYPSFLTQMQVYKGNQYTLCNVFASRTIQARSLVTESPNYFQLGRAASPIEIDECIVDSSNTLTFKIILMMGVIFVSISAIISFYIDKVDRKVLLISWLWICSLFAISIALIPNFYMMSICFMIFLSCGLCGGIISAISIALFPTNFRAMATCLILMFGRLGAVGGSNFVGLLLDNHCELIFYLYGGLILSCAVLCFFLNTNPKEPLTKMKPSEIKCES